MSSATATVLNAELSRRWRPKPRRRSELGLLIVGGLVVVFAYLLASLGTTGKLPDHTVKFIVGVAGISAFVHICNRRLAPDADPVIMPVALVLNGIGYVMIGRLDRHDAGLQLAWTLVGVGLYAVTLLVVRRSRDLERYRYLVGLAAIVLLLLPLAPHFGEAVNGARLWVHVGSMSFQPVEIAKILLVIFFASYLIEKRELLTLPTVRVGNHLLPDIRSFGPIVVAWAVSLFVIVLERDIGFSLLVFLMFIVMLWAVTGRVAYLLVGVVLFAVGTFVAAHMLSQVSERITVWLDPWKDPLHTGYQPIQGELAFARGGLFGSGLGLGDPGIIPAPTTDFIFAALGEELGLLGAAAIVVGYLLLVGSGLRASLRARSDFAKLTALGLTCVLGFQAFFIMAGILRLLPLTGVTLPFVSYGGSSLVANYVLLALLMRIADEGVDHPPKIARFRARRLKRRAERAQRNRPDPPTRPVPTTPRAGPDALRPPVPADATTGRRTPVPSSSFRSARRHLFIKSSYRRE